MPVLLTYRKWVDVLCPACRARGAENLFELGNHAHLDCMTCGYNWRVLMPDIYAESRTAAGLEMERDYGETVIK